MCQLTFYALLLFNSPDPGRAFSLIDPKIRGLSAAVQLPALWKHFQFRKLSSTLPLPPCQPSNCERLVIALRKLVKFLREFCRSKLGGISITIWKLQILGGEFVISDRISILFGEGEAVAITGGTLANVQF